MTGIIINEGEQYYTDLKDVLTIMGDSCKDIKPEAIGLEEYNGSN